MKGDRQSECIVDVITDVRVDDDGLGRGAGRYGVVRGRQCHGEEQARQFPSHATHPQNFTLTWPPIMRGSLIMPVAFSKLMPPTTRISLVQLRQNAATSYLPWSQI